MYFKLTELSDSIPAIGVPQQLQKRDTLSLQRVLTDVNNRRAIRTYHCKLFSPV